MTGVTIVDMDMDRLCLISLIKESAVPREGRLRLRDARRDALVSPNVAAVRLGVVKSIRSPTSFLFKLSRESNEYMYGTICYR